MREKETVEDVIAVKKSGHLASWEKASILNALEEFANLAPTSKGNRSPILGLNLQAEDVKRFRNKYPEFFPKESYDAAEGESVWPGLPAGVGVKYFRAYQQWLRLFWRGDTESPLWEPRLLDALLGLEPDGLFPLPNIGREGWLPPARARADPEKGILCYKPACAFQDAVWMLFRRKWRAKECGRCSKLFVADKISQRLCSQKCSAEIEKIRKQIWWAKHGEEWRAKRQANTTQRRGKRQ